MLKQWIVFFSICKMRRMGPQMRETNRFTSYICINWAFDSLQRLSSRQCFSDQNTDHRRKPLRNGWQRWPNKEETKGRECNYVCRIQEKSISRYRAFCFKTIRNSAPKRCWSKKPEIQNWQRSTGYPGDREKVSTEICFQFVHVLHFIWNESSS